MSSLTIILLVLFGQIFHGTIGHTGVPFRQYFAAGIIASGIMSTSFVNLGVGIAVDRDDGTLKRLAGTPMPRSAYFIGKATCALVISAGEAAILLAIGVATLVLHLLAVYPGPPERGWHHRYTRQQLQAPGSYRLYRAIVSEYSILCPRDTGPCTPHGVPFDHRTLVPMVGQSR